jgi:hypothetical protein
VAGNLKPVPNDDDEIQQRTYSRQVERYKKPNQSRVPAVPQTEIRQEGLIIKRPNKQDLVHAYKIRQVVYTGQQIHTAELVNGALENSGARIVRETVQSIEEDLVDTAPPGTVTEAVMGDVLTDSANRTRAFHDQAMQVFQAEAFNIIQRGE